MDLAKIPKPQLEGFYLVGQWITMRLHLQITIINYVEINQRIYIQAVNPNDREDRRAWYILSDGNTQPI
ncbi:MAG: hypothetical protein SAJ37_02355 [Oscillatoria sp. PMC 1068.18]|nr:hypothetical protein [Oscillatoria sp. PMC 1076.18]MEC4987565.1 hypothetical protein [Oscillatoria sp. PMC 1068.18]